MIATEYVCECKRKDCELTIPVTPELRDELFEFLDSAEGGDIRHPECRDSYDKVLKKTEKYMIVEDN